MSDRIEPSTHIDIRVVRSLLMSRISEGRDMLKNEHVSSEWKKKERQFQDCCRKAVANLTEAIQIKEGKANETSNKTTEQRNTSVRESAGQNKESQA